MIMNPKTAALHWGLVSRYRTELMGIASIWVMFHHNFCSWPNVLSPLQTFFSYGSVAVDIFLFLSGIGLFYGWQKDASLGTFYRKRLARVLIPYVLLVTPYWCWRDLWLGEGNFWMDLTQLSFLLKGEITTWYIPTITVFYMVYPLVAAFLSGAKCWKREAVLVFVCVALCVLARESQVYRNCEIGLTRFVIFSLGCCAGRNVYENRCLPGAALWLSLVWLLLNWAVRCWIPLPTIFIRFSFVPLALSILCILTWLLDKIALHHRLLRFLRFFGEHSLELYLTHILVRNIWAYYWGSRLLDPWGFIPYGLILLCSVVLSIAAHRIIVRLCAFITATGRKEKKCQTA